MATRNEYTGYIPASNPIDWGKLTGGLVSTITGIGEGREAEKQALDKLAEDNARIIQNTELGKTQTFDNLILGGGNMGRDKLFEWNRQLKAGEIDPVKYKNKINNLKSTWSAFANTAKSYDQQMQETLKRQSPDEKGFIPGSELEEALNLRTAQLGDLRNKAFNVTENGDFVIGNLDENGLFDPSSVMDLRSIGKPGNMIDNRINLDAIVDNGTKNLATWIKEEGSTTTSDPLLNPAVQKARIDFVGGVLNNSRSTAGVLTGYSGENYDYYFSNEELKKSLEDRVSKQNEVNEQLGTPKLSGEELNKFIESEKGKFILLAQDDQSVYQPNLTDDQIKKAKAVVLSKFDSRLGKSVTQDEPIRSGGGSVAKPKEEKQTSGIPGKVYSAWNSVESLGAAESEKIMSQASGGKYSFKWEQGGLNVYKPDSRGQLVKQNTTPITNPQYLSDYFGYAPDKWTSEGKKGTQSPSKPASYSSAQEANIKATLKANPGATRQQAIEVLGYQ